jgi:tRNA A37 threonylcarbamoyltransferase TsaD
LTLFKKNVVAFSFTGIRSAVERMVESEEMTTEEQKSLGRAAQVLVFEHVAEKTVLGMRLGNIEGVNLVVSGGVACNMAFRKM